MLRLMSDRRDDGADGLVHCFGGDVTKDVDFE